MGSEICAFIYQQRDLPPKLIIATVSASNVVRLRHEPGGIYSQVYHLTPCEKIGY